jgi:hypothetical protein
MTFPEQTNLQRQSCLRDGNVTVSEQEFSERKGDEMFNGCTIL